MKPDTNPLSVGGFLFYTEKDAQIARAEEQKIQYLEERIDYSSPERIQYIYEKTIHERMFRSPVGLQYLKQLQEFLLSQPKIDPASVTDIPLYMTFDGELRGRANPARARVKPSQKKDVDMEKLRFAVSAILNVLLVLAIAAMFYISFASEQPNIFNYEQVLTNKYASWEQELTQWAKELREKELQLRNNSSEND